MLLSMPWTWCPCRSKCSTASEPIKPLEPVTRMFMARELNERPRARERNFWRPTDAPPHRAWKSNLAGLARAAPPHSRAHEAPGLCAHAAAAPRAELHGPTDD